MKPLKSLIRRPLQLAARLGGAEGVGVELHERLLLAQGKQLAHWVQCLHGLTQLEDAEFRIFSQFGDDGIIQYLISHIPQIEPTFIEFGVEDYSESNTRFLLMNNNWSGLVMDGSTDAINRLKNAYYFWRQELAAVDSFITAENIESLIAARAFGSVGLLSVDLDGNDYWIWKAIESIQPAIVISEYNSAFGPKRAITIPYDAAFHWSMVYPNNFYFGASLAALATLGQEKGYALVGCNNAGNNAYFVRTDLLNTDVRAVSVEQAYRRAKYLRGQNMDAIQGRSVYNVTTQALEAI